ncbi:MAG: NAD(P)H-hydrate dehydratase [Spirochaetales bacterium]|nr:NAD(P)H-hydrate dehydratase [Spirochaetales bacterium]
MKVSSVVQMRHMDKTAVERYLIPEEILMENAGLAACSVIRKHIDIYHHRFLIICGSGNNGGDGLVVARKINSMGGSVKVFIPGNREKYKGVSATQLQRLLKTSVPVIDVTPDGPGLNALKEELNKADVIVDALFGTGLTRTVEGYYSEIIQLINESKNLVVSLDIPSGVNGDTGRIMGNAVKADFTVTFGLPKYGNLFYPGFDLCGKLFVTHISFPPELYESHDLTVDINIPGECKKRDPLGHKGSFGDVLFIAGASQYLGAPFFSAYSFLKAGGGYSRLATPQSLVPSIASGGKEIVFIPLQETESKSIAFDNRERLLEMADKVDMVVMGPGLSLDPETQKLVCFLTEKIGKPLLLDGDGLTALAYHKDIIMNRKHPTILTPHPGEMATLTGKSIADISENSIKVLCEAAKSYHATIVLKQAHSLIGFPDGRVFINLSGNSGMATAGSGDVLTGTIAAMTGLGFSLDEAVLAGVFIHGISGDKAAEIIGEDGMTAGDILDFLPSALSYYRENYTVVKESYYNKIFSI